MYYNNKLTFNSYKNLIYKFLRSKNIQIDPLPNIYINNTKVNIYDPFIKTGSYNHNTNTIELCIYNRHLKDILRTFFHELIHHSQYLRDSTLLNNNTHNNILDLKLRPIEEEAYSKGNLLFREWTQQFKII